MAMAFAAVVGQALASAALDPLLEKAINAAVDEIALVRSVHGEIRKLTPTLNLIRGVLGEAEKRQVGQTAIGDWLRQLKEVFLDADDLLDEYTTDAALQSACGAQVRPMKFTSCCFTCVRGTMTGRAMALQLRKINESLDHLARQRDRLGLQMPSPPVLVENSRPEYLSRPPTSSLLADENSVVGRDRERKMIVDLLLSSLREAEPNNSNKRSFSVLSIVGMGGTGKTTLAKLVYNDEDVQKHFQLRMWVCVSSEFDVRRLTQEIIDDPASGWKKKEPCYRGTTTNWDTMQVELREKVQGRTFLLVLDDVWEAEQSQWDCLFEPLKFGNEGSKIVITTRNRDVVDKIQGRMDPIPLGGLSDADMWSLFKRYAFSGVTNADGTIKAEHSHLEAIGERIVEMLKGSPLAARTIGSLLNTKLDARHWKTILNNRKIWALAQGADGIFSVLGLSYLYLHADLKQCFAYCSLFPKDYWIRKEEFIQLWNAQCFIKIESGTVIEATGNKYFDNLVHRSFLQSSPFKSVYAMHDLIHDLAEHVSEHDCFRLEDEKPMEIPASVRHISSMI